MKRFCLSKTYCPWKNSCPSKEDDDLKTCSRSGLKNEDFLDIKVEDPICL